MSVRGRHKDIKYGGAIEKDSCCSTQGRGVRLPTSGFAFAEPESEQLVCGLLLT